MECVSQCKGVPQQEHPASDSNVIMFDCLVTMMFSSSVHYVTICHMSNCPHQHYDLFYTFFRHLAVFWEYMANFSVCISIAIINTTVYVVIYYVIQPQKKLNDSNWEP